MGNSLSQVYLWFNIPLNYDARRRKLWSNRHILPTRDYPRNEKNLKGVYYDNRVTIHKHLTTGKKR